MPKYDAQGNIIEEEAPIISDVPPQKEVPPDRASILEGASNMPVSPPLSTGDVNDPRLAGLRAAGYTYNPEQTGLSVDETLNQLLTGGSADLQLLAAKALGKNPYADITNPADRAQLLAKTGFGPEDGGGNGGAFGGKNGTEPGIPGGAPGPAKQGGVQEQFDRLAPSGVTGKEMGQSILDLLKSKMREINVRSELPGLSPETLAGLDKQTQAELLAAQEQSGQGRASLLRSLFGRGMARSTVAGDVGGRLVGQEAQTRANILANAANRAIGLQESQAGRNVTLQQAEAQYQTEEQKRANERFLQSQQLAFQGNEGAQERNFRQGLQTQEFGFKAAENAADRAMQQSLESGRITSQEAMQLKEIAFKGTEAELDRALNRDVESGRITSQEAQQLKEIASREKMNQEDIASREKISASELANAIQLAKEGKPSKLQQILGIAGGVLGDLFPGGEKKSGGSKAGSILGTIGKIGGTIASFFSSRMMKEDIAPFDNPDALLKLLDAQPMFTYKYKPETGLRTNKRVGLVIESTHKNFVKPNGIQLDEEALIFTMWGAIKALKKQVEELQGRK
jgi:hypothetical protein